jgi:hypothetical protein
MVSAPLSSSQASLLWLRLGYRYQLFCITGTATAAAAAKTARDVTVVSPAVALPQAPQPVRVQPVQPEDLEEQIAIRVRESEEANIAYTQRLRGQLEEQLEQQLAEHLGRQEHQYHELRQQMEQELAEKLKQQEHQYNQQLKIQLADQTNQLHEEYELKLLEQVRCVRRYIGLYCSHANMCSQKKKHEDMFEMKMKLQLKRAAGQGAREVGKVMDSKLEDAHAQHLHQQEALQQVS